MASDTTRLTEVIELMGRRGKTSPGYAGLYLQHAYKILGPDVAADYAMQARASYQLGTWLTYDSFDPTPYPGLMAILEREGLDRPPPVTIPCSCPEI